MNHYRSRVREVINRNEVVNLALAQGWVPLVGDSHSALCQFERYALRGDRL